MHLNCFAYFLILINKTVVLAFPFEHVFPSKYQSLLSKEPQEKLSEKRTKILKTKKTIEYIHKVVFWCFYAISVVCPVQSLNILKK